MFSGNPSMKSGRKSCFGQIETGCQLPKSPEFRVNPCVFGKFGLQDFRPKGPFSKTIFTISTIWRALPVCLRFLSFAEALRYDKVVIKQNRFSTGRL
jgi:hypothetical protein